MSKDVDRKQVFQTTRVRTSLRNDISWIQKSNQENKEDKASKDNAVETRPVVVRQSSYVLSTAKKFELIESPLSSPLKNTQFIQSEGNSAYQANGEVILLQKDAQPEGSTVETTDDTKPQALPEELIQNDEAQPEKSVANTSAENKEVATIDQTNLKHNEEAAEVSADIHVEEHIQHGEAQPISSSAKENPEAVSPMEPAQQPVANTAAKNKGECADIIVDRSNTEHIEVNVSADAHVEDPVAETSATVGTEESKDVPAAPSEPSDKTQSVNAIHLEHAGVESTVQPAEDSCGKCPLEQAAEEIAKTVAEALVESSPDKSDVINATLGVESALQDNVEPIPDLVAEPASESPSQSAAETAAEGSCEIASSEQAAGETVEAVAEVIAESLPETPISTEAAGEEGALQDNVEPIPDLVAELASELPSQPAADPAAAEGSCELAPPEQAAEEIAEAVAEALMESSPDKSHVINAPSGDEAALKDNVESTPDLVAEPASESPSQSAAETAAEGSCEIASSEQAAGETVEAVAEVIAELLPETPVSTEAAGEEGALQDNVEPVPDLVADTVSELPIQPVKCNVVESVLETRAEEVVESEIQLADNIIVEQSVDTPKSAADRVDELSIEDAVEPVTDSDAEAVQDKLAYRAIELTEALDVEPPTAESASEPLKDQEQPHTEETKLNQSDDTNTSEKFEKPVEEPQSKQTLNDTRYSRNICSFCDIIIDGNVKLTFSEPLMKCHPECLKCGVCAKALGDTLTPMFLHNQVIQCDGCFAKTL